MNINYTNRGCSAAKTPQSYIVNSSSPMYIFFAAAMWHKRGLIFVDTNYETYAQNWQKTFKKPTARHCMVYRTHFCRTLGLNVLNLSKSAADFFEHVAWCVETAHWWTAVSTRTQGRERLWYNNNARLWRHYTRAVCCWRRTCHVISV